MNNFFVILTIFLIVVVENIHSQDVTFQTQALASIKKCEELKRDQCLTYHECEEKCASVCDDRIKNGDKQDDSGKKDDDSGKKPKKKGCFHGDDIVMTTAGAMKMSQLVARPDLQVLSRDENGQTSYSSIYYWIHANPNINYKFLLLKTENGQKLTITDDHMIYETTCDGKNLRTIFAGRVRIGRCVYVNVANATFAESRVVSRKVVRKTGIYAPITYNGNIVVNDVLASCFTNLENESLQKIMYSYMNWGNQILKNLSPDWFIELFYSTPFNVKVNVPEIVFSFWDLGKTFVR